MSQDNNHQIQAEEAKRLIQERDDVFGRMVSTLAKPGADILATLTPEKCHILHMAFALPGEVGELCDAIKKWIVYGKPLDTKNVLEELGDTEFYLEGLRQALAISRNEVLAGNMAKLAQRYGQHFAYTDKAAIERKDKLPEQQAWAGNQIPETAKAEQSK